MKHSNRFFGYKCKLSDSARKDLKHLDKRVAAQVMQKLDELVSRKERLEVKMLVGIVPKQYRLRVGDYRVIFIEHEQEITIIVIDIGHRKEVYRGCS
jgi:mRNA interferase RelE/StbE